MSGKLEHPDAQAEYYEWLEERFMPLPPAVRLALALAEAVQCFEMLSEECGKLSLMGLMEALEDPDITF